MHKWTYTLLSIPVTLH